MTTPSPRVVVVGGGISGLTAALAVSRGLPAAAVTVVEASPSIGGKLVSAEVAGITVDAGAESVLARRPEALDLFGEVGLAEQVVYPGVSGAGILVDGTMRALPRRQLLGIPWDLRDLAASGVISSTGLLRIPLDHLLPRTPVGEDISVGELVAARLGREVVDRLVEPLLGGVYAGHADELSLGATLPDVLARMRTDRSLLSAVAAVRVPPADDAPVFASLRGGLGRLPAAVAAASGANVLLGTPVERVDRVETGWLVSAGPHRLPADAVILAAPAAAAATLLAPHAAVAASLLAQVDYASVALVTYVFPRSAFDRLPSGTGFLVPPHEERVVKAATYASLKWPWVASEHPDRVVLRASVGRHRDEVDLARDDDDLAWAALGELATVTGVRDAPLAQLVTRWDAALPQYAVGHPGRVATVREGVARFPTLAVCGAALDGVGIPACIASGRAAAAQVAEALRATGQWGNDG
ncbi:MAG: protoporphyrinogen oxidase [Actinomycetota bacterium]|nr:protoporphyrinogen oxidase [Actinomycetota bacterium]